MIPVVMHAHPKRIADDPFAIIEIGALRRAR
jgi:hypothetical protein